MERIPEAELMEADEQARAYAAADFSEPHALFIDLFRDHHPDAVATRVLDLGCGPADISCRFAAAFPACRIDAVDGAAAMLRLAGERLRRDGLAGRIHLHRRHLPQDGLPAASYDVIISNSLLHHLGAAQTLWDCVRQAAGPAAAVFIMDLLRPASRQQARDLVSSYAAGEARILQEDFYHSLLAAYSVAEIREQLRLAGLDGFTVQQVSDRHVCVAGVMPD